MTNQEFISLFELKYNAIVSNAAPHLDEFEMSEFLTSAQKEIVLECYNGSLTGDSFEGAEDVRQYINELIKDYRTSTTTTGDSINVKSKFYNLPNDVWFRIIEWVDFDDENFDCDVIATTVTVTPITHDEYHLIKNNPFRKQNKRRVLRLDYSKNVVELISEFNIGSYVVRYLAMPTPIVLTDLQQGLSIDGVSVETECQLNTVLHEIILNRAVDLAKFAWQGAANSKV